MEITTERLKLRPHGTQYLESTHKYATDYENTKYMMALPSDSLEATKEFLVGCENEWQKAKPSFYEFAIIKDGIHIGAVSFYLNDTYDTANIGWILDSNYHGCGYASEAATALIKFAYEDLGIGHFIAFCDSENLASEGVMKKIGMTRVSLSGGRKNKSSDEERKEFMYEMSIL